jgi:hypothetical protein
VSPRAGLNSVECKKTLPLSGIEPRTPQSSSPALLQLFISEFQGGSIILFVPYHFARVDVGNAADVSGVHATCSGLKSIGWLSFRIYTGFGRTDPRGG